jgi:hypothetical protein
MDGLPAARGAPGEGRDWAAKASDHRPSGSLKEEDTMFGKNSNLGNLALPGFLLGTLAGIGLAMLLEPRTRNARRKLNRKARRVTSQMKDRLHEVRDSFDSGVRGIEEALASRR